MRYRIGWITPLTPRSGIGTFSNSVLHAFPKMLDGVEIDVTVLYVENATIYTTGHRAICIRREDDFRNILDVFDLLIYNIGNNAEHHEPIFELLRIAPGVIICHDYVYQHYLAGRAAQRSPCFTSYAALLRKFSGARTSGYIRRSQITSSNGHVRYGPWDADVCTEEPMSEALLCLGSAIVVHSAFSRVHAERYFDGPILELGMPYDIRAARGDTDGALVEWDRRLMTKPALDLVSFGHIQSSKCIDTVIAAIAGSKRLRERVRYTIAGFIGDKTYYDELVASVHAQGLEKIVSFESDVTDERLQELMLEADVFMNLRRPNTEAASLSLVEQLDMGRPVVVIASGCYSEVPVGGALKLPPDVTGPSLANALERLIDSPKTMVAIGRAGQRFARTWTSRRYAEALLQFVLRHQTKLAERGRAVFHDNQASGIAAEDRWAADLARARSSLIYFDRNILRVDPRLIQAMSHHELCSYACEVIFGLFRKPRLTRALSRFFARLDASQTYWACVTLALVADAAFRDDDAAMERLINGHPCLDPEFWSVMELLPPRQMFAAATLLLARRRPTPEELADACGDEDVSLGRSRVAALLSERTDVSALDLLVWAQDDKAPPTEAELPTLENVELQIGRAAGTHVLDQIDLSGFYPIEHDRAWTRGGRGLIGVRLDGGSCVVEVTVTPLFASLDRPNTISLAYQDRVTRVEVQAVREVTLRLTVDVAPDSADGVAWLVLATDNPGVPPNAHDRRMLGLSLHLLRVTTRTAEIVVQREDAVVRLNDIATRMRGLETPVKAARASGG